ncbi:MAG: EVE domain-containing protein [Thermoprotei archaeon]|nr:EVE domain-containing protein [Thermoprotei archaeon]
MPNYWIFPISEENWLVIKESRILGIPEAAGKFIERVKPGDIAIMYIKNEGSGTLGGMFVGAFKVTSTWFREETLHWPDEAREGKVKYPWRVRLEPLKLGRASFQELIPKLSFIKSKNRRYAYLSLRGTPANRRKPIPKEDGVLIIESLK